MNSRLVVLTRDEAGNAVWRRQLEAHGLAIYGLPCIETAAAELTPDIERTFEHIRDYHWLVFSSAAGVRYFLELMSKLGLPLRALTGAWIAAVGTQTADAIRSLGLPVTFTPSRQTASTLAQELKRVKSRRILFLRTGIAADEPIAILRGRSADVTDLPIYQTLPREDPDPGFNQLVRDHEISHIVFASPSAVHGFGLRLADPIVLELAHDLPTVAIGPTTAQAAEQAGFRQLHVAARPSVSAILKLLS
ncbi:MAG TPA: uroporphyrinogen-III synthase [Candidatus Saccharimonadia bacterium]